MSFKKRKLVWLLCFVLAIVSGVFAFNWFMTYRLEGHLRRVLVNAVSDATDGFYKLSYDHLSIGFFDGELRIEGLGLRPDSAVFSQLFSKDSLPNTYLELHIKRIDFKGLNIVWLLDRRKLHFELFEIDSPVVEITDPVESGRRIEKNTGLGAKTLYEMVSPYLDVVSVKRLNLIDADISFVVKDPVGSSRYALYDANFQAYGFLLNDRSSQSGKLLFCDNFEFTATQEQTLLSNPQFLLKAANIRLSTEDSIISIKNIVLSPKYDILSDTVNPQAGTYVGAVIKEVEAKGIRFKRENYLNYLDASLFEISGSDIQYIVVEGDKNGYDYKKEKSPEADTVSSPWSLYEIISPLIYDVSIDKIGLDNTKFKYTQRGEDGTDYYMFDQLDFVADGFHLDSLSNESNRFMYSMDYKLDVTGLQAYMKTKNYDLNIGKVSLNTKRKNFRVKDIRLQPITTQNRQDYIEGKIDSITMYGIDYLLHGVYAEILAVNNPEIRYVRNKSGYLSDAPDPGYEKETFDDFISIVRELNIKRILVKDGDFIFDDNYSDDHIRYKLLGLNFYAKDFEISPRTKNSIFGFFDCSNLGFSIDNFDNYLSGKDYRLQIKHARFSHLTGQLNLKGIKLIPQKELWKRTPEKYYSLNVSSLDMLGLSHKEDRINVASVNITTPQIEVIKTGSKQPDNRKLPARKPPGNENPDSSINHVFLKNIRSDELRVSYKDISKTDSLFSVINNLDFNDITWNRDAGGSAGLGKAIITGVLLNSTTTPANTAIGIKDAELQGMKWHIKGDNSFLDLDKIRITNPSVKYEPLRANEKGKKEKGEKQGNDVYSLLGAFSERITVGHLDVTGADFNYISPQSDLPLDNINNLNLSVEGFLFDKHSETLDAGDIRFTASDFSFPLNDGFYTLNIGSIGLNKQESEFNVNNIHLLAKYPKKEFAYRHPKHKDWFDVTAGNVSLKGIDFNSLLSGKGIRAGKLSINDVMLQNFKNQQIEIEHNIMPLIYENIQKAPVSIDIPQAYVTNFSVIYEELAKKKTVPGVISFIGMNGYITGLTNIVRYPDQYMRLDADGRFMGNNPFKATWMIPVDSLNDCFYLAGHLEQFDLKDLNQLTEPLGNVRIESGIAKDTKFDFEASSYSAQINMALLYNDLKINILKGKDEENMSTNKFVTGLANLVIKSNNPRKEKSRPKTANLHMMRDPYHSTFNYFWQILQPALGESVGVSQKKQNFGKGVAKVFKSIKNFFSPQKGKKDAGNHNGHE